jgi:phytanoyl-CoA hydroxylase
MTATTADDAERLSRAAADFARDGFCVARGFCASARCDELAAEVRAALDPVLGPAEYEADVGYPGAPTDRRAPGGDTPRRLLHAYSRFAILRDFAAGAEIARWLRALMGAERICLSQCHHNCVMTKAPGFSSATLWHQDVRYWRYQRPELVSAWLALGRETEANGALQVIPGSHLLSYAPEQLDELKFLRTDRPDNQALIAQARTVELDPGDVLFFHCRTFHAAGRNRTDEVKLSAVFTYHAADNHPLEGTRSAQYPGIPLESAHG